MKKIYRVLAITVLICGRIYPASTEELKDQASSVLSEMSEEQLRLNKENVALQQELVRLQQEQNELQKRKLALEQAKRTGKSIGGAIVAAASFLDFLDQESKKGSKGLFDFLH